MKLGSGSMSIDKIETVAREVGAPIVQIGLVGINFKTTPISIRERISKHVTLEQLVRAKTERLLNYSTELVLLSTCNRVEVYFASEGRTPVVRWLYELFSDNISESDFEIYYLKDKGAADHLFKVASGLDSLVLGEAQILSQVRDSCRIANERSACGPVLSKLFSKAYSTGKEIRESYSRFTNGFKGSVSTAVVDLITQFYKADKHKEAEKPNLLLVGSGKMIRLAVDSLDRSSVGKILVAARRAQPGRIPADVTIPISDLTSALEENSIDVIITATSSQDYVLTASELERHLTRRKKIRPLLIFDISVPRNVDPTIPDKFPSVVLFNLDDLKDRVPDANKLEDPEFEGQLAAIQTSISVRVDEFISWLDENSEVAPVMGKLRRKAETIRAEELENALHRLSNLTPGQKEVISKMSERVVKRLLHDPANNLREMVRSGDSKKIKTILNSVDELFSLENAEKKSSTHSESFERNETF